MSRATTVLYFDVWGAWCQSDLNFVFYPLQFWNMPSTDTVRPALINPPLPFLVQGTEVLYTVYI